ncbi:MAG: hypothetical protein JST04_01405 [Bdellovibrionales bacterium]|nr:hypothetical protein [Bdellovibrionales bacterium]
MEPQTIEEILAHLIEEIGGDWLLAGGALVRLNFDADRGTEDIDLARMGHPTLSAQAALNEFYRWLIARGDGPERVNTAVEPFLEEVPHWNKEVVELRKGSRGRIYRPNLTLFVYLKLRRGTEIDLEDVRKAAPNCQEGFDEAKFLSWGNEATSAKFRRARKSLGL